jgi:hypothetical protein
MSLQIVAVKEDVGFNRPQLRRLLLPQLFAATFLMPLDAQRETSKSGAERKGCCLKASRMSLQIVAVKEDAGFNRPQLRNVSFNTSKVNK